jgi:anti-sigma regulatory factor (Ser/Thr protein kinase)
VTPDDDAREVVLTLPRDVDAPAMAREYVSNFASWLPAAMLDDARLLVSELVGNAVRYGRDEITLRLRRHPPGIGVAVTDRGDDMPTLPDGRPDPTAPSGRGLLIVATLASHWGIEPAEGGRGKTVWFDLQAPA